MGCQQRYTNIGWQRNCLAEFKKKYLCFWLSLMTIFLLVLEPISLAVANYLALALHRWHNIYRRYIKCSLAGADPGEVKWVNFHPPFSEPPSFFFFLSLKYWPQTPQPGFGSTLLQKFTPHFKILDPRLPRYWLTEPNWDSKKKTKAGVHVNCKTIRTVFKHVTVGYKYSDIRNFQSVIFVWSRQERPSNVKTLTSLREKSGKFLNHSINLYFPLKPWVG